MFTTLNVIAIPFVSNNFLPPIFNESSGYLQSGEEIIPSIVWLGREMQAENTWLDEENEKSKLRPSGSGIKIRTKHLPLYR